MRSATHCSAESCTRQVRAHTYDYMYKSSHKDRMFDPDNMPKVRSPRALPRSLELPLAHLDIQPLVA